MAKTVADVMNMVKENEVKFVDFRFTDTRGKEQHVTVPVSHFDEGKFTGGVQALGLAEGGVGWALDKDNKALITADMQAAVDKATADIKSGKVQVHDYMADSACPVQ